MIFGQNQVLPLLSWIDVTSPRLQSLVEKETEVFRL